MRNTDLLNMYVVMTNPSFPKPKIQNFINNNIGRIVKASDNNTEILVGYEYNNLKNFSFDDSDLFWEFFNFHISNTYALPFHIDEILKYPKNKQDLEYLIESKKYNL